MCAGALCMCAIQICFLRVNHLKNFNQLIHIHFYFLYYTIMILFLQFFFTICGEKGFEDKRLAHKHSYWSLLFPLWYLPGFHKDFFE